MKDKVKSNVLAQLIEAMLGETGERVKPKVVTIDVMEPVEGKEGLEEVLDEASKDAPEMGEPIDEDGDGDHDEDDHEAREEDCEEPKRKSLREFLSSI